MSAKAFLDTNVLVNAHDKRAPEKQFVAASLVERLWENRCGILSVQVLQEFYLTLIRLTESSLGQNDILGLLKDYLSWQIVVNDRRSVIDAIELRQRYQISFWDALIVNAANKGGAEILYSENHQ